MAPWAQVLNDNGLLKSWVSSVRKAIFAIFSYKQLAPQLATARGATETKMLRMLKCFTFDFSCLLFALPRHPE